MYEECERPEFYSESAHTARKPHTCCECRKPIAQGERYVACRMKYDGDFSAHYQHVRCYHFARYLNYVVYKDADGCVAAFGEVAEVLRDHDRMQGPLSQLWARIVAGFEFRTTRIPAPAAV